MWSTDTKANYKVLLMGGLGNQFFQIARAIELRDRSIGVQLVYIDAKLDWLYRLGGHTKHDSWLDVSVLAESLGLKYRSITLSIGLASLICIGELSMIFLSCREIILQMNQL